jgi:hypothetical protein
VFVFPERAGISECRFLHRSIGAGRRVGITETNRFAGDGIPDIPTPWEGTDSQPARLRSLSPKGLDL